MRTCSVKPMKSLSASRPVPLLQHLTRQLRCCWSAVLSRILLSLIVFSFVSHSGDARGQETDLWGDAELAEEDAAGGAAQPDPNDFSGFTGTGQQPDPDEEAQKDVDVARLNQEANAKLEAGDLAAAETLFLEAVQIKSNFDSLVGMGRVHVAYEELREAIPYYNTATRFTNTLEDASDAMPAFMELGQVLLDLEQYNEAISTFSNALRIPKESRNPEAIFKLGLATTEYAINQQYVPAQTRQEGLMQGIQYFDKAIRVKPDYAEALYERGNSHLLLGDADKALDDLSKAVQLEPSNTDALAQLGFVSLQRGLSESGQRNGQSAKILFDLNRGIEQLTRWLSAVPEDQEVDEDDPEAIRRENVLLNRSAAYIGLGEEQAASDGAAYYQKAMEDANAAIEIDPDKSDAYYQKGVALRMLGDLEGAIEALTEAAELSTTGGTEALLRRGIIYFRQGDLELAKADFEKAIQFTMRGQNARAYFWLGLCYQTQGEVHQAVTEYTRALRVQPRYLNAYVNRGLAYMSQGRYERAIRDFSEVLRIDRNHSQARELREQAIRHNSK